MNSIEGGATWSKDSNSDMVYSNGDTSASNRAIMYSTDVFQSTDGFILNIEYTTGSIENIENHNLSFGLISDETDLSTYKGFNPFSSDLSVNSIGVNLTTPDSSARGLNYTNGTSCVTLDEKFDSL